MDYYLKYLATASKLKNVRIQAESKIRKLEKEIDKLKIEIIKPAIIPQKDKELVSLFNIVCEAAMITPSDLMIGGRKQEFIQARFCFIYLAHEHGYGCSELGRFMNKHHSSIIHGRNEFEKWLQFGYKYEVGLYNGCKSLLFEKVTSVESCL
jgi:chromosomal replication initiation ATPase DnaA